MGDFEHRYSAAERKFRGLVADVHLPFLEVTLYEKYFIDVKTDERLRCLEEVCDALNEHRVQTLRLLKLIHEREAVLAKIAKAADDFANQRITALEVQTTVLQLLYEHQTATLQIVEGILSWREGLTRPYAFQWQGMNYISKIKKDCKKLDESTLRKVLPLRVTQFPLCSNITSLSLFAQGGGKQSAKGQTQSASAERTNRLRAAEAIIFEEENLQAKVLRELSAIADTGRFVPLLRLPHLVPDCSNGIPITRTEWDKQLKSVMADAAEHAANPPPSEDEGEDADRQQRSRTPSSHRSSPRSRSRSPSSRASTPRSHHSEHQQDADV